MAVSLTHTTQAVGTDAGNGEIGKTQWNEEHTLTMATGKLLGRSTAGTGAAEEITVGTGLSLSGGSLTATGSQNTFTTIAVAGQSDVVADSTTDTLTLAAGSNITITTNATTDTITIAASGGGTAAGSDTQIQFNDGGTSFGGDADLTWNKTTNTMTLTSGSLTMTGNISSAAWTTSGLRYKNVSATLTDTTSTGTVAAAYTNVYGGNTIAASNSTTFTDYFTTFITQPTAGTNVTFTNRWALGLSGNLKVTGDITATGAITATNMANGRTLGRFTPLDNQPTATNFATLDTRNSVATLDFDDTTQEEAVFVGVIPQGATLTSGIKVRIFWAATSATTGNVRWGAQFEKYGTDIDSDSFDTATEAHTATSGTSGIVVVTEITCTTIDSLAAGDQFRVKIYRDASDTTNDTVTGDAELIAVELQQVA